jgi:hypothetical protein
MNTKEREYSIEIDRELDTTKTITLGGEITIPLVDEGMIVGDKWIVDTKEQWEEEFQKLIKHDFNNCAAHSEGQYCCLDIEHKRNKQIIDFIRETREQAEKHGCTTGFIDGQILGKKEVIENITPMLSPGQIKYLEDFLSE